MGAAKEMIAGFATNVSTTLTTVTASGSGDSFAVKSFDFANGGWLEDIIADMATSGEVRVLSPRLHDQVNGIRLNAVATLARDLVGPTFAQRVYPQDTLITQATSGAADSSVVVLGLYYESIPGLDARLASWSEVMPQIEDYMGTRNQFNTSGTIGTWAGEAINADFDNFVANRDYAIVGLDNDARVSCITYRGPETGNVRNGAPGEPDRLTGRQFFVDQDLGKARPRIPVINSANRGATLIEAVDNAATTALTVSTIYALLRA